MHSAVRGLLLSVPFSCVASVIAWGASTRIGFVSEGLDCFYALVGSCLASLCVTAVVSALSYRRGRHLRWTVLLALIFGTAGIATICVGQVLLRSQMRILLHPVLATRDVRVLHSRSIMFAGYLHVRCTKEFCAEVIRAKALKEIPGDMEAEADLTPMSARRTTQALWDWWRPADMPGAKFYFRHHTSEAPQGWSEGIWTSGDMTEMYLFIRG